MLVPIANLRYTSPVRRLHPFFGTLLLILCGLPSVAPLLALAAPARLTLPACCRRAGVHQCSLKAHTAALTSDRYTANLAPPTHTCPLFPTALPTVTHGNALAPPPDSLIYAELLSHPATRPQTRARARIALGRARQKRGPPASSLL